MGTQDYNDGKWKYPCLRLDFGGREYNSVELGDGTCYIMFDMFAIERASCDALKLYSYKEREILLSLYALAGELIMRLQPEETPTTYAARLNLICKRLEQLGIEVE